MIPKIGVEQTIRVGEKTLIESPSPTTQFTVVFEDDGETGYFYGLDGTAKGNPILDALHIYNIDTLSNKDRTSMVQIVWSGDGMKSGLFINGYPHAVFDFADRRGYCRTNFPPPDGNWTSFGHEWRDAALDLLR